MDGVGAFVELMTRGGVVAVMAAWIFYLHLQVQAERSERQKLQSERDALLERVLTGLNNSNVALGSIAEAQNASHAVLTSVKDMVVSGRMPS